MYGIHVHVCTCKLGELNVPDLRCQECVHEKLTNIVFPFPGGPNNKRPRAGALRPVKSCSGMKIFMKILIYTSLQNSRNIHSQIGIKSGKQ